MTTPTAAELALLKTQPHKSKMYLSIFEPQTVFAARVNDAGAAKGDQVITYDSVTVGNFLAISGGMTMYVGTTAGGKEKGEIWTYKRTSTTITVGENSHINWANNDYLTIVNFHQIWPVYPRYTQSATDITVFKFYDLAYSDQNEDTGALMVMGGNYAGFINQTTGSCMVYYDGSETSNVKGTTGSAFSWSFEGGTPTGSTAVTPGWINYTGTGHYRTLLSVTTPDGNADFGIRHVSVYDRPGEGSNTPVLSWGLESLAGSRDEGGYTARIWVKENVSSVVDGALVVLFTDDWYGTTQQSVGGNFPNREEIFFVGYIVDGSIDYDYQTSTVFFDVGSPSEIMKLCEAFSVSVEDSGDPNADAGTKGGDPWFYFVGLSIKSALWHYYAFHSSCQSLMDMRYIGTDFDIQYFDADRTSLYDASDSFLRSTVYGKTVCDRQGALYFEVEAGAIDDAVNNLDETWDLFNPDWIGNPAITEQFVEEVSYLEMGGVAYYGISGGSGTYSALLAAGPGLVPAYRGNNQKMSGLALTSQGQLNTLVGNIWENMNADYPEVDFDLSGNFRNIDIVPQEIVKVTLQVDDTYRGISWSQKEFTPRSMTWSYDSENSLLMPSVTLKEITAGDDGQTIAIPVEPPDDNGFDGPPIIIPPPLPPLPRPPTDWSVSGNTEFIPIQKVLVDGSWAWEITTDSKIEMPDAVNSSCMGNFMISPGYAGTITIEPIFWVTIAANDIVITHHLWYGYEGGSAATTVANYNGGAKYTYAPGDTNLKAEFPITFIVIGGEIFGIYFKRYGEDAADDSLGHVRVAGWRITYT